jgi:hypothetical protein
MNLDINTPTDDLLEAWVMHSQKLINNLETSKTEIDEFRKLKLVLKTKGIMHLEIRNVFETEYVLHYIKQGGGFEKHIMLNK